eukprot:gnl/MRDRNA2_/MRDRNA2_94528_c0_seq1.p1 gnl/MRDRNA2_/MRDRNA2_94528_c0~~gnl/MRDRNA2_/MRDRNA2_94528_c0_seq1.p1  ORF type:complete len:136 (+),score=39.35 gnl/MRDRNA2_/MRDRNA2_94528_c0_seq1:77-484(+)
MAMSLLILAMVTGLIESKNLRNFGQEAGREWDSSVRDRIAWAWETSRINGQKNAKVALPWANLKADGGDQYEHGESMELEADPSTFSISQYEHPDMKDDDDVAEDEPFEDDQLNHGETDPEDGPDGPDDSSDRDD